MKQLTTTALALLLAVPALALACGPEGARTHVGTMTAVDPDNGTFTLLDAQTRRPMTFRAGTPVIDALPPAGSGLSVGYEAREDGLHATGVEAAN